MNAIFVLLLLAHPGTRAADIAWIASGEFCEPETVLALPDDTLLVSNVCDFRQAGTGFLSRLGADGAVIAWRQVDELDAPLGMALHGDELAVVDANRLRWFSWPALEPLRVEELGTQVANDVAIAADGNVYITDTATGNVHVFGAGRSDVLLEPGRFAGANGIAVDGRHLYVGGERLWRVDLDSDDVIELGPDWLADIDGIEVEPGGGLQVTSVGGPLVRLRDGQVVEIHTGENIKSANHGYAPRLGLALIPTGFDNQVIAIRIEERGGRSQ